MCTKEEEIIQATTSTNTDPLKTGGKRQNNFTPKFTIPQMETTDVKAAKILEKCYKQIIKYSMR